MRLVFKYLIISFLSITNICFSDEINISKNSSQKELEWKTKNFPYNPGQYSWEIENGNLLLISGKYTNQETWDVRTYNFYVKTKNDFYQVPIEDKNKKNPFQWTTFTTWSGAEWLMSDMVVVQKNKEIYLIKAEQNTPKSYADNGDLIVTKYKLKSSDDDIPYIFKEIESKTDKNAKRISVDIVLNNEAKNLLGTKK